MGKIKSGLVQASNCDPGGPFDPNLILFGTEGCFFFKIAIQVSSVKRYPYINILQCVKPYCFLLDCTLFFEGLAHLLGHLCIINTLPPLLGKQALQLRAASSARDVVHDGGRGVSVRLHLQVGGWVGPGRGGCSGVTVQVGEGWPGRGGCSRVTERAAASAAAAVEDG